MAGMRARRKAERPGQILEAAFDEFVLKGYSAARLEDVAKRVGVTKGTIYFYFESKERVFEEAVHKIGALPLAAFNRHPTPFVGHVVEDIRSFLRDLYQFIDANPRAAETLRLLIAEAQRFPNAADAYFTAFMDPVIDRLRLRLIEASAAGEIRHDLLYGAEAIASPPFAYMIMSLLFPDKRGVSSEKLLDSQVELLLGGLWHERDAGNETKLEGDRAEVKFSASGPTNNIAERGGLSVHWLERMTSGRAKGARDGAAARRASAVDIARGRIRSLIRERRLTVGDALPSELELASICGASRNTIREAVQTLKAFGVVESRKRLGAVLIDNRRAAMTDLLSTAMEVSTDAFQDIQGFRRLTEMNLGEKLVGRLSDDCMEQMAHANRAMAATEDPIEAAKLDFRFHQLLVEAAGNQTLAEIYGMLEPVICRLMQAGKSQRAAVDEAAAEHGAILRALREGDGIGFTYHMNRHLDAGLRFLPPSSTTAPRGMSAES